MIDFDSLTLGEVALIEELSGQSIGQIADESTPKGKALAAIAMVTKRRQGDPTFTWNQANALTLDQANAILGLTGPEDEDEGKGERSELSATESKPSTSSTSASRRRSTTD